ncbi:MAG TPA: EamA family transporter [Thermoleophilia bacterium]|nr:EamA family transporter [Thermoleophilia bacterium]
MTRRGWVLFIALCIIWGIPYLFIRIAVEELSAPALVFFRTAPAALLMAPFAFRHGDLDGILAQWRWVLAYALVEIAVPWVLLFHAEERISSSLAGLLVAATPLIAAVGYRFFGHDEDLDRRRRAGLVIGLVGVATLVGIDASGTDPLAILEMFGVAVCYAMGPLIVSRRLDGLSSPSVVAVALALTAAIYFVPTMLAFPATVSADTVGAVATLSLVCTVLAFVLHFALIREVGPARSTVITYVNPLVAVLLGVALLDEPFTTGIAVGLPLILLGSALGTAPSAAPGREGTAPERDAASERDAPSER